MLIKPANDSSYKTLLEDYEWEQNSTIPKNMRGYIERHNQHPISAFLNVSMRNHQNLLTRVGHISLSLQTPIHLDILAWASEQKEPHYLNQLRDAMVLDLVHVKDTRGVKA